MNSVDNSSFGLMQPVFARNLHQTIDHSNSHYLASQTPVPKLIKDDSNFSDMSNYLNNNPIQPNTHLLNSLQPDTLNLRLDALNPLNQERQLKGSPTEKIDYLNPHQSQPSALSRKLQ